MSVREKGRVHECVVCVGVLVAGVLLDGRTMEEKRCAQWIKQTTIKPTFKVYRCIDIYCCRVSYVL